MNLVGFCFLFNYVLSLPSALTSLKGHLLIQSIKMHLEPPASQDCSRHCRDPVSTPDATSAGAGLKLQMHMCNRQTERVTSDGEVRPPGGGGLPSAELQPRGNRKRSKSKTAALMLPGSLISNEPFPSLLPNLPSSPLMLFFQGPSTTLKT